MRIDGELGKWTSEKIISRDHPSKMSDDYLEDLDAGTALYMREVQIRDDAQDV